MSLLGPGGTPLNPETAGGLVSPEGLPLGMQPDSGTQMNGLRWGVTFLVLDNDVLGVLLIEPDDVEIFDVGFTDGLPPQQWIGVRGRPKENGEHRFVNGWGQMPGMAASLLVAHMDADLAALDPDPAEAAVSDHAPPEPEAPPEP